MTYRALTLIVMLLTGAAASTASGPAAGQDRPNVLFIAVDDLNDWVGFLGGHPQVKTPNMDRLAARGVAFTNAHCQAPLCNPSRASILTGRRPSSTGIYGLNPWLRTAPGLQDVVTLPQYFSRAGYHSATGGKVFHDAYPPRELRGPGPEFDEWGYHGSFGPAPPRKFVETPDAIKLMDWGVFPERDEDQEDYKVASWAVKQIEKPRDKPLFLSVGFRRPHVPLYASRKWFDLYPRAGLIMPPILTNDRADTPRFSWYLHWKLPEPRLAWMDAHDELAPFVQAYLASTSFMDSQIGRLLDALDRSPKGKNTVIVLWSDHGYHIGEKEITGKNTLWERSTRVPLIIAAPGVAPGGRCAEPAELLDMYPTLADLCGLPAPAGTEGLSLRPQLQSPASARSRPAITTHGPGNHAVRTKDWRYIEYADGSAELYNLALDPNEWYNLAELPRFREKRLELRAHLPTENAPPAPESRVRLVEMREGVVYWEGSRIPEDAPIPTDLP